MGGEEGWGHNPQLTLLLFRMMVLVSGRRTACARESPRSIIWIQLWTRGSRDWVLEAQAGWASPCSLALAPHASLLVLESGRDTSTSLRGQLLPPTPPPQAGRDRNSAPFLWSTLHVGR